MSEQKYRQRGYMDNDRNDRGRGEPKPKQQPQQRDREGPRSPRMMAYGAKVIVRNVRRRSDKPRADSTCPKELNLHPAAKCTF